MDALVAVPPRLITAVTWWTVGSNLISEVSFLANTDRVVLVTDASTIGWGAIVLRGLWSEEEKLLHINCLESNEHYNIPRFR